MTPEEHETLRLKMRGIAQQTLLDWLADVQRLHYGGLPEPARSQTLMATEKKLSASRDEYSTLTLGELHPVESDLHTALFQEAFDELSSKLLTRLRAGWTPEEAEKFRRLL